MNGSMEAALGVLSRVTPRQEDIPFVPQVTRTDCGVSCLLMALGYFGLHPDRDEVRRSIGSSRDGVNAFALVQMAERLGLRGRIARIDLQDLADLPRASVLHWQFDHFVLFDRPVGDGFAIVDPQYGRRVVSRQEMNTAFTGLCVTFERTDEAFALHPSAAQARQRTAAFWGRLLRLAARSGPWGRILAVSVLLQGLTLFLPLTLNLIVGQIVPYADHRLLLVLSLGAAIALVMHFVATLLRSHLLLVTRTIMGAQLATSLVERLLALPLEFFQQRGMGDLMARINSTSQIRDMLTSTMLSAGLDGTLFLTNFVLLAALSPRSAVAVAILAIVDVGIVVASRERVRDLHQTEVVQEAKTHTYAVEMLAGIETLKAMGAEARARAHWSDLFAAGLNANVALGRVKALREAASAALRTAAPLVLVLLGTEEVFAGRMSLGTMLAVNALSVALFVPLSQLIESVTKLQQMAIHLERIRDVEATRPEQDTSAVRPAHALGGAIELRNVSFRYAPTSPLVLRNVSLRVRPGEFVAIVGASGSGKSTLAALMLGLFTPSEGEVAFDGVRVGELDLRQVRRQIGVVMQQASLFGTTIRANIALADPSASMDRVVAAARAAQIHDDIVAMPLGYETVLVNRGLSVSGGQRQRIALARALLGDPRIVVLDEATSALDAVTEQRVCDALVHRACTRVVVAHRLSSVVRAHRIVVVDDGRIVEEGTHEELLARRGRYAALFATQVEPTEASLLTGGRGIPQALR